MRPRLEHAATNSVEGQQTTAPACCTLQSQELTAAACIMLCELPLLQLAPCPADIYCCGVHHALTLTTVAVCNMLCCSMHLALQLMTAATANAHLGIKQGLRGDPIGQRPQVGSRCHKLHCQVVVLVKHCCAYVAAALFHKQADALDEHLQRAAEGKLSSAHHHTCQAVLQACVIAGRLTEQTDALDEQQCPPSAACQVTALADSANPCSQTGAARPALALCCVAVMRCEPYSAALIC